MKNMKKLAALMMALLLLVGATAAFASTYVSDPISPSITTPSGNAEQQGTEATPVPEVSATPAPDGQAAGDAAAETEAIVQTESGSGNVNIRAAASADAEIIGQLSSDMRVSVLGVEGDWSKIRADSIVGYVYSKYLQVSTPEATPAPVETKREVRITTTLGSVINVGDPVTMNCELVGFDGLNVRLQWQQNAGGVWRDITGANDTNFSYVATEETVNSQWRVAVSIVG